MTGAERAAIMAGVPAAAGVAALAVGAARRLALALAAIAALSCEALQADVRPGTCCYIAQPASKRQGWGLDADVPLSSL